MDKELTDEEELFLRTFEGTLGDHLAAWERGERQAHTAKDTAFELAQQVVDQIRERHPSRTEQLLLLSAFAITVKAARDSLLKDLLERMQHWYPPSEGYPAGGWNELHSYDMEYLANLCGLSRTTVKKWRDEAVQTTYDRFMADLGVDPITGEARA